MRIPVVILFVVLFAVFACSEHKKEAISKTVNWESREAKTESGQLQFKGSSYLSVYSEIYDMSDETKHLLTATVSLRNTSLTDSLFISKADYYNTKGNLIRSYIKNPIYLVPMETVEIVINRRDTLGGSGANFIFDWATRVETTDPIFESVMIWTTGTQGISFLSKGVRLK